MPKASVIIPVYNGEKTIKETVESALSQTLTDFELIVIDDGSTDSTLDVLSTIQDSRLKVFSYANAGVSASRNRGIELASGEYIAFLDADDLWTPDKLEFQVKALEANPQASVAYSWVNYIDECGQIIQPGTHTTANGDVFAKLLVNNFLECGSNPLIRKQALNGVGGFDSSVDTAEDRDMWLRLAAQYYFVAVPVPQILYRRTNSSASNNIDKHATATLKVLNRSFAQAPESVQHLKKQSLANLYLYLAAKTLKGPPKLTTGLKAIKFLWRAFRNNPRIFQQTQYVLILLFKILIMVLLPSQLARTLLSIWRSFKASSHARSPKNRELFEEKILDDDF